MNQTTNDAAATNVTKLPTQAKPETGNAAKPNNGNGAAVKSNAAAAKPATETKAKTKAVKPAKPRVAAKPKKVKSKAAPVAKKKSAASAKRKAPVKSKTKSAASVKKVASFQPRLQAAASAARQSAKIIGMTPSANSKDMRYAAQEAAEFGKKALEDFFSGTFEEIRKAQERLVALGEEGAEQWNVSGEGLSRGLEEVSQMGKKSIETLAECGNIATQAAKTISSELYQATANAFSENVECSKDLFACRNVNDVMELNNRLWKSNVELFVEEGSRLADMIFRYGQQIAEPLNDRLRDAAERITRITSAD